MKLLRYGPAGKEKPGLLDSNGKIRDLSRVIDDINGAALSPASLRKIAKLNEKRLPLVKTFAYFIHGERRHDPRVLAFSLQN